MALSYRDIRKSQDLDLSPLLEKLNLLDDEHLTIVVHRFHKSSLLFQDRSTRGKLYESSDGARSITWPRG